MEWFYIRYEYMAAVDLARSVKDTITSGLTVIRD